MFASLGAHLVFFPVSTSVSYTPDLLNLLEETWKNVCKEFEGRLVECAYEPGHGFFHLVVAYPPKHALSTLINSLKSASSLRARAAGLISMKTFWSPSYCAVACNDDDPMTIICAYVDQVRSGNGMEEARIQ